MQTGCRELNMGKIWAAYIFGGQELHPLCHLVAEAQEIIVGEGGGVADGQVHSAAS